MRTYLYFNAHGEAFAYDDGLGSNYFMNYLNSLYPSAYFHHIGNCFGRNLLASCCDEELKKQILISESFRLGDSYRKQKRRKRHIVISVANIQTKEKNEKSAIKRDIEDGIFRDEEEWFSYKTPKEDL